MDKENGPGYIPSTLREVRLRDLPKAIVVHEMLGIGILLSVWGACYRLNPTRRMMSLSLFRRIVSSPRMKNFGEAYDRGANAWNRRFSTFSFARYVNPQRAAESLGESFVVRKFSSPLLVPMKIWLAFKLTA